MDVLARVHVDIRVHGGRKPYSCTACIRPLGPLRCDRDTLKMQGREQTQLTMQLDRVNGLLVLQRYTQPYATAPAVLARYRQRQCTEAPACIASLGLACRTSMKSCLYLRMAMISVDALGLTYADVLPQVCVIHTCWDVTTRFLAKVSSRIRTHCDPAS